MEWAEITGIGYETILWRLNNGETEAQAFRDRLVR
jgi:hypothetical protein